MTTELSGNGAGTAPRTETLATRFEVAILPVSDVERAKVFYERLGWRLDGDGGGGDFRLIQMTPPGSNCSIIFGKGVTDAEPGSIDRFLLAVDDIDAARQQLVERGADVGEVFHDAEGGPIAGFHAGIEGRAPGRDPKGVTYASYATVSDPDGNVWMLQEITTRMPRRVEALDPAALSDLLHEASEHHGAYEALAPPHDWWDWYAAYMEARQRGNGPEDSEAAADQYMADAKQVVVDR